MPNIEKILKQIQKELSCPVCGRKFEINNIKLRGSFGQTVVVQTNCTEGHITLFMTTFDKKTELEKESISADDVLNLTKRLEDFNGDFETLWTKQNGTN